MSTAKQKNIVGVFVFLILQIMFLFSHFTVAGAVNTVLVLLYLILRNIISNKTDEKSLSVRLGNYIALSFLNVLLITLFQLIDLDAIDSFIDSANFQTAIVGCVVCCAVLLIAYGVISASEIPKGPVISIVKYLIPFGVYSVILNTKFYPREINGNDCLYALAIFYLMFWLVELYIKKSTGKTDKSIIIAVILSSAVIVLMSAFDSDYTKEIIYGFTHLKSLNNWKWYTVVIIAAVFIAAVCVLAAIDNESYEMEFLTDDTSSLALIAFDIICFAVGIQFYTKYIAVFAIMLFAVNFITLIIPFKRNKKDSFAKKIFNSKFTVELIMMVSLVFLYFGFINGIVDMVILLILSAVIIAALIESNSRKYSLFVLLLLAIGCDMVYHWHNAVSNYILVGAVAVLLFVILAVIGIYNPDCIKDDFDIHIMKFCVLVLGTVIMLTPMSHTGAHIYDKIEMPQSVVSETEEDSEKNDKATITIYIRPHGKNNSIESCTYYWTSNSEKVKTAQLEDNSFSVKKKGSDTLVVVCRDSNGVETTYKHTYNIKV